LYLYIHIFNLLVAVSFNVVVLKILITSSLDVETIFIPVAEKKALVNALECLNFKTGLIVLLVVLRMSNKQASLKEHK